MFKCELNITIVVLPIVLTGGAEQCFAQADGDERPRGVAKAEAKRPAHFPHRIWAACDFEGQTPDYAWFGVRETKNIPAYAGNSTALAARAESGGNTQRAEDRHEPCAGTDDGEGQPTLSALLSERDERRDLSAL